MRQYPLNIYQPDTDPPAPDALEKIMAEIEAIRDELQAQGNIRDAGSPPGSPARGPARAA